MSKPRRDAPPDSEFRRAVADVAPLPPARRTAPRTTPPAPVARQRQRDERAVLAESLSHQLSVDDALDSGEELTYLRDGLQRKVLKDLRRGHWVVQDSLDLHGMNRAQAAHGVAEFLRACAARGTRCVRIVHGKGHGSRNREPVLKGLLRGWLAKRDEVLAYCQAPAAQGGGGAALVLLKAR